MNKQEIIKVISDERSAHEYWASQESLIADAINLDSLIVPINYEETDLYTWIKSNKSSISAFTWYKELEQAHVKAHYSYSDLFENATRKYNPKTREQLLEEFKSVKNDIEDLTNKFNQIENDITEMSDIIYLDYVLKSNAVTRKYEEQKENNLAKHSEQNIKQDTEQSTEQNPEQINDSKDDVLASDSNAVSNDLNELSDNTESKSETKSVEVQTENADDKIEVNSKTDSNPASEATTAEIELKKIDISDYTDIDSNNESNKIGTDSIVSKSKAKISKTASSAPINNTIDSAKLLSDYESIKSGTSSKDNLEKHIALKEQNITRLKNEKELSEQELKHLEETQKLSQLGVKQLEQRFLLKQEEVELEQLDNEKLLETNTIARDRKSEHLEEIEQQKITIKKEIIDLEQENIKDELVQEEYKSTPSVEKQFEVLKTNKLKEVDKLQKQLSDKNAELIQLKQQVLSLADEVADIEDEIEMKQQGIVDLEDKEQSKNNDRTLKLEAKSNIIKQRNITINNNNEKLDELSEDAINAQNELNELIINFEKMKKTIFSMADVNDAEIDEIESQQVEKQKKLTEIYNQKTSKQTEIEEIQNRIDEAEKVLSHIKSEFEETNKESTEQAEPVH